MIRLVAGARKGDVAGAPQRFKHIFRVRFTPSLFLLWISSLRSRQDAVP